MWKKGFFCSSYYIQFSEKILDIKKNRLKVAYAARTNTFNIRSSFYINRLRDITIYAHDGRNILPSNPHDFIGNKYSFKIGQITYNRHLPEKRTPKWGREYIIQDMKKKRGAVLKISRRKKYTYYKWAT